MNDRQRTSIDAIKTAIAEGGLTKKDIERRLNDVITHEINKKSDPADLKLVEACLDLLCEIQTHGQFQFESHASKNKMAVLNRYEKHARRDLHRMVLMRAAAVTAILCICALGIEIVFHREFFVNSVTPDEQQYYVQGVVEDPNLFQDIKAETDADSGFLVTDNIDEAIRFLGFEPSIPGWIPEGYSIFSCSVHHQDWYECLFIDYRNESDERGFSFECRYYADIEEAYATFEQDISGMKRLAGEQEIYCSNNEGDSSYVWCSGTAVYALYRVSDEHDPFRIIESVTMRGDE